MTSVLNKSDRGNFLAQDTVSAQSSASASEAIGGSYVTTGAPRPRVEGQYVTTPAPRSNRPGSYVTSSTQAVDSVGGYVSSTQHSHAKR